MRRLLPEVHHFLICQIFVSQRHVPLSPLGTLNRPQSLAWGEAKGQPSPGEKIRTWYSALFFMMRTSTTASLFTNLCFSNSCRTRVRRAEMGSGTLYMVWISGALRRIYCQLQIHRLQLECSTGNRRRRLSRIRASQGIGRTARSQLRYEERTRRLASDQPAAITPISTGNLM